jgi:hypothetical protein
MKACQLHSSEHPRSSSGIKADYEFECYTPIIEWKSSKELVDISERVTLSSQAKMPKHTTGGIPRWSPTLVLVARFSAYVWQSGRDAQFSLTYGRMCWVLEKKTYAAFC